MSTRNWAHQCTQNAIATFREKKTPKALRSRFWHVLFLLTTIVSKVGAHQYSEDIRIEVKSKPFVVWDTQDTRCNNHGNALDLPDVPARAFRDKTGLVHLFTADTTTWISYGHSLLNVTRNYTIAYNATSNPDPRSFATNEFIDATYSFGNGTIVALLHTEYPGDRYNNCRAKSTYPHCWTVSVGLALSHDWGYSWSHAKPPSHHLVAAVPYEYDPTGELLAFGWGDTSGIMYNPKDNYYYTTALNRNAVGLQSNGTCVFRTRQLLDPSSWRAWDGRGSFSVKFANPYTLKSDDDPANHICAVLDTLEPGCNMLGVTYSVYLERFVGSIWCPFDPRGDIQNRRPFLFTTSQDMIHWSQARPMFDPFSTHNPNLRFGAYPTLIDVEASSARGDDNFQTIGQSATLFYVQVTNNFFKQGRQLMGVNITFHSNEPNTVTSRHY